MTTLHIPRTAERCVDTLAEAGALITAKEWQRAAIVAALVGPAVGRGTRSDLANTGRVSSTELAAKGIVGLASHTTVERYRDAWCAVRPAPTLGDAIELDGLPDWPPDATHRRLDDGPRREAVERQAAEDGVSKASALRVAESPAAVAAAIKADPQLAVVAREALRERDAAATRTERRPAPWDAVAHARLLVRDLEALVQRCAGLTLDDGMRDALREAHTRLVTGCAFLSDVIDSDAVTDDAIREWVNGS